MALPDNGLGGFLPNPAGESMTLPWPEALLPMDYVSSYVEGAEGPFTGPTTVTDFTALVCGEAVTTVVSRHGLTATGQRFEATIIQSSIYRAALIDAVGALAAYPIASGVPGSILIQDDVEEWESFVDLVNLGGKNWVAEVEWGEDVEKPVPDFRLLLFRTVDEEESLSPFMEDSIFNIRDGEPYPLVMPGKLVRIQNTVDDVVHLLMDGVADAVDPAGDPDGVVVEGRGIGADILDRQIEEVRQYGGPSPGSEMGGVFQTILLDWAKPSNPDILFSPYALLWGEHPVPGSPYPEEDHSDALLTYWDLPKGGLLQSLLDIAAQAGRDLRYRPGPSNEPHRLTFYAIPRNKVNEVKAGTAEPDFVAPPSAFEQLTSMRVERSDVRNKLRVFYTDVGSGLVDFVTVADVVSQKKYGVRYAELDFTDSFIDTNTEALALALAGLSDLAEPWAVMSLDMPFKWDTALHQVWEFPPDDEHYSASQYLAVVGYRHKVSVNQETTTVRFWGRPAGSVEDWLRKMGPGPDVIDSGTSGTTGAPLAYPILMTDYGSCGPTYVTFSWSWGVDGDPLSVGYHAHVWIEEGGAVIWEADDQPLEGTHEWSLLDRFKSPYGEIIPGGSTVQYHPYRGFVEVVRTSDGAVVSSAATEVTTYFSEDCSDYGGPS